MNTAKQSWVWLVDDDVVHGRLSIEGDVLQLNNVQYNRRAASHPAVTEAVLLHLAGESERALAALRQAVAAGNADALLVAGQIAFEADRMEEAARHYKRLADLKPDHPYASLNAGICLARLKRWRMAIEALQRAVVLESDRPQAWYVLGVCLLNEQRAAEARASFAHSLRLRADYVPAWFGEAAALQLEGKVDEALAIYDRLLAAQPTTPTSQEPRSEMIENALLAAWQSRDRTRLKRYASLLVQQGESPSAASHGLWAQVVLAVEAGDFHSAAVSAATLAHGNPASAVDWFNHGVCLRLAGKTLESALAFESAVRLAPDDIGAWCEFGAALWACGQMDKAAEAYEAVLFSEPGNQQARRALLVLALERGDVDRALDLRDGVNDPGGEVAFGLGVLQHRLGHLEKAAAQYLESLSRQPERAECQWNLAHALFAMQQVPEAKMHWRKALELEPDLALTVMR